MQCRRAWLPAVEAVTDFAGSPLDPGQQSPLWVVKGST